MRMRVITSQGLRYGGQAYAQGDEFELAGTEKQQKLQMKVLKASKKAESADPFVMGAPPPLPRRRGRPPLVRPPATLEPAPESEGARTKQTVENEQAQEPAHAEPEPVAQEAPKLAPIQPQRVKPADNPATAAEEGTYQRRDLRAEE
jgi:hypothetical protein